MGQYTRYPSTAGEIPTYANAAALPATASDGAAAITLDTDSLYIFNAGGSTWKLAATGGSTVTSVGPFGSSPNANGGSISGNVLTLQPADGTHPGGLSIGAQSIGGNKTFTGTIGASNLSGTNTGDVTIGTANGLSLVAQALSLGLASTSTTGALSSTDWNTFNGKQGAGNYITALTGDGAASGPGSAALTLATVNSNVGSFGDASHVAALTVNGKGLVTAAASTSIQIAESQVTNLVSDLAGKQATGNYITALTSDVTASGPGSASATIAAGAVTLAKMANLAANSIIGNNTGSPATPIALTAAQVNTLLGSLSNPMTTLGDVIYEDASPAPARLAGNTTTTKKYLAQTGNGTISAAPAWSQPAFSELSGTASSTQVTTATFVAPTVQRFTSSSGTYTLPSSPRAPLYIKIRMLGGGGGGGGGGSGASAATNGGNTTWNSTLLVANGGSLGGSQSSGTGGAGGSTSNTSGPILLASVAGSGGGGAGSGVSTQVSGGTGGCSPLGGAGSSGVNAAGGSAATNSGSGGGGGSGSANADAGGGGGAGGYIEAIIASPSATYSYAVGSAGGAGTGGSGGTNGGAGSAGVIIVEEFYQ